MTQSGHKALGLTVPRAACIVAAIWPERVRGLVTCRWLSNPGQPSTFKARRTRTRTISTIFRPSAVAAVSLKGAVTSIDCSGSSGRRRGRLTTRLSSGPLSHSTIQILLTWLFTPIDIGWEMRLAIRATQNWRRNYRRSRKLAFPQFSFMEPSTI